MTFLFVPDSFKGSLSASRVCELLSVAAKKHFPSVQIDSIPVADGGEGTVEALVQSTRGKTETLAVRGPM